VHITQNKRGFYKVYTVSQKVPTFKLTVTCQISTDFQNVCTAGKRMKFAIKPIRHYPIHFGHVATLPWAADIQQVWKKNKLHFECTDEYPSPV